MSSYYGEWEKTLLPLESMKSLEDWSWVSFNSVRRSQIKFHAETTAKKSIERLRVFCFLNLENIYFVFSQFKPQLNSTQRLSSLYFFFLFSFAQYTIKTVKAILKRDNFWRTGPRWACQNVMKYAISHPARYWASTPKPPLKLAFITLNSPPWAFLSGHDLTCRLIIHLLYFHWTFAQQLWNLNELSRKARKKSKGWR